MTRGDNRGEPDRPAVAPKGARGHDAPKGAREQGADDAATGTEDLFPDQEVTVRDPDTGEPVALTLREFRFREGLEATAIARPFITDLAKLASDDARKQGEGEGPDALAFDGVIAAHPDLWLDLIARACGREADWIARLADRDARLVRLAMWAANGPFFVRRLVELIAEGGATARLFRSIASSTRSPAPATDAATRH